MTTIHRPILSLPGVLGICMCIFASCQCADYVCVSYAGAGAVCMACVTFTIGNRRSYLVFVVSKPQWSYCANVPDLHLHRQRTRSTTSIEISECVRLCDAHMAYTYGVTTFRVTFLSMTHHVRMYVLCENRSSIQSLALMRLAIIGLVWVC